MKIMSLMAILLLASGCAIASPTTTKCASVLAVKTNPQSCVGRTIRVKAYLISTRHGDYLVDAPDGTNVLSAEILESGPYAKASSVLLEKLGRANKGKPYASLLGTFEGRLVVGHRGEPIKIEILAEVQ